MKSDTPGQVEIISTKLTVAKYKCICSIRKNTIGDGGSTAL